MTECPTCQYPYSGSSCDNPGCTANPAIPASTKDAWLEAAERSRMERAERDMIYRARGWAK